jgi:hypothetical protein
VKSDISYKSPAVTVHLNAPRPLSSFHPKVQSKVSLFPYEKTLELGVAETANIAEIAKKILNDIFGVFFWELRPIEDTNFECVLDEHKTLSGKDKATHPCDVLFHYIDPYLNKTVYLHTDLKSYSKKSLQQKKIRESLNSLSMTLACAHVSQAWRDKYPKDDKDSYEIRGLLFVANHDGKAPLDFNNQLNKISTNNLSLAKSQILHVLGPRQISDLYSVAADIKLSIHDKKLSQRYRFFYPDLTLWKRRVADDVRTAATVETLLSPYFILKHDAVKDEVGSTVLYPGSLIYYSRAGNTIDEFVYLLDSLLRYQLVKANEIIRIRIFNPEKAANFKSNFDKAKVKYCKTWGFESTRAEEINAITIDSITQLCPNYSPDEIGWKENK